VTIVVQLFIMKNGALEGTELVSGDRFIVGSDPTSAVVLDDPSIGPRHLGVFVHDGRLAIQDLGAPGGTHVGTEQVTGARYVGPREDVFIGAYTLKLKLMSGGVDASALPHATGDASPAAMAPRATSAPPPSSSAPMTAPQATAPARPAAQVAAADATLSLLAPQTPSPRAASSAAARPLPSPAAISIPPRAANVMVGAADLERTLPGASMPTQPPISSASSSSPSSSLVDGDQTVSDGALPLVDRASWPGSDAGAAAAGGTSHESASGLQAWSTNAAINNDDDGHDDYDGEEDDEAPVWSLVQRLVQAPVGTGSAVEVIHYRGERVLDHRVVHAGGSYVLGDGWSKDELHERGLSRPLRVLRLAKGGRAELTLEPGTEGRLLRDGRASELSGGSSPLQSGEVCSLRVGDERLFLRFAGVPGLLWSPDEIAAARAQRRLTTLSGVGAAAFFGLLIVSSWLYGFRSKSEDVINIEDDGFAEVVQKELTFEEPPKPPEPIPPPQAEPLPEPEAPKTPPRPSTPPKTAAKVAEKTEVKNDAPSSPEPPKEAPKPGLAAMLDNIPKVNDSASSQNLTAALSNIKGVRVPGEASGFKTSDLTGKGPTTGVQIGGAAGGLATSGINSLIRKDGAAGQLGGKGDRQVAGRVTTQPRMSQVKGAGELSKDEIQRVISQHVGEIQFCYEKQLRTNPGLNGRVVLEWTVTTSGSVGVVKVSTSSLPSNDATRCMMDKVKTWKFPRPRGNGAVTVVYPFVFNTL
jgi:TonB family protein